jgi:hypothetical protein
MANDKYFNQLWPFLAPQPQPKSTLADLLAGFAPPSGSLAPPNRLLEALGGAAPSASTSLLVDHISPLSDFAHAFSFAPTPPPARDPLLDNARGLAGFGLLNQLAPFGSFPSAPSTDALASVATPLGYSLLGSFAGNVGQPMVVAQRFEAFLSDITLTPAQRTDGETKHKNVRSCLNAHYYGTNSETANSRLVGSWGKATRVRPPRDIDVLFELPVAVYHRYEARGGNKQSQLLQEVKDVLLNRFPNTAIKGDGPAVVIPFATFKVELVPAIKLTSGQYWICLTQHGGSYKIFDPTAELQTVEESNKRSLNKTRDLVRMAKVWQAYCSVPIKSFYLELLAIEFLRQWPNYDKTKIYYDWMVRDYFAFIQGRDWTYISVPGTAEQILLNSDWKSRAESAYARAAKACENETGGYPYLAGEEWQKIFGTNIPMAV